MDVVFDIVCLSEHWLADGEIGCGAAIGDWRVVSIYSRKTHIHGGVLILAGSALDCRPLVCVDELSVDVHCELTGTVCRASNTVIVCVYRSPMGDFNIFLDKISIMLEKLVEYRQVIISGDFNVWFET